MAKSNSPTALRSIFFGKGKWGQTVQSNIASSSYFQIEQVLDSTSSADFLKKMKPGAFDAAFLCVPPSLHAQLCTELIRKNIPCFVEKPLTMDVKESLSIGDALKNNPLPFHVNHIHLFSPAWNRFKKHCASIRPSIERIESKGGGIGPFREYCTPLWDYAPHDASMLIDLLGEPVKLVSASSMKDVKNPKAINYKFKLHFEKDVESESSVGNAFAEKTRSFIVHAKKGVKISVDDFKEPDDETPLLASLRLFHEKITSHHSGVESWEFAHSVVRTIQQIENIL